MFLTQVMWESTGLRDKEEIDPPKHGYRVAGDPPHKCYHGRGYIQLTGSENYKAFSRFWFNGNENVLFNKPELVAADEDLAWGSALWYWAESVHDRWSDGFQFTTKAINPNYECLCGPNPDRAHKRFNLYKIVCKALNIEPIGGPHWQCDHRSNFSLNKCTECKL